VVRRGAGAPTSAPAHTDAPPALYEMPPIPPATGQLASGQRLLESLCEMFAQFAAAPVSGLLGGMAGSVYDATLSDPGEATQDISTNEMRRVLLDGVTTVIDGRTRDEYDLGHLPGALSVAPKPDTPMSQYVSDVVEIGKVVGDLTKPIVVYCNGPFCGKSRRLGEELLAAGFSNVRRYQLGTPVWRALVGQMVVELDGLRHLLSADPTAVFIDTRSAQEFAGGSLPRARNLQPAAIVTSKDDGRLPMDDFNTRVVAFGATGEQARAMAQTLTEQGFNNVKYLDSDADALLRAI
jgi:rhodanese-related sulfurtransferase